MSPILGFGLEQEAIRLKKNMPKWIPASLNGNHVAVYNQLPITFKYYEE
jgi:hypothetical protein